jgi:hypothetical protein
MKAESKEYPKTFQPQQGGWLFNYNVVPVEKDMEGKKETFYQYESVWVEKKDKSHIVPAMVRARYSANDEFEMARASKTSAEWKAYDAYVKECIAIANETLKVV